MTTTEEAAAVAKVGCAILGHQWRWYGSKQYVCRRCACLQPPSKYRYNGRVWLDEDMSDKCFGDLKIWLDTEGE